MTFCPGKINTQECSFLYRKVFIFEQKGPVPSNGIRHGIALFIWHWFWPAGYVYLMIYRRN